MPKGFSEREKALIRAQLLAKGRELFATQGIKKANVEDQTKAANISKGAFYLFFNSKEELFFELLGQFEDEYHANLIAAAGQPGASPRQQVKQVMNLVCADSKVVPEELVLASMSLIEQRAEVPGLDDAFLTAAKSIVLVNARRGAYWRAMRNIKVPVFLMSGDKDRLVPVGSARATAARNPSWRFDVFEGVGHVPQIEIPEVVAERLLDWLGSR